MLFHLWSKPLPICLSCFFVPGLCWHTWRGVPKKERAAQDCSWQPRKAHRALDAAVEKAYGRKFESDAERVAHLFALYRSAVA